MDRICGEIVHVQTNAVQPYSTTRNVATQWLQPSFRVDDLRNVPDLMDRSIRTHYFQLVTIRETHFNQMEIPLVCWLLFFLSSRFLVFNIVFKSSHSNFRISPDNQTLHPIMSLYIQSVNFNLEIMLSYCSFVILNYFITVHSAYS